MPATIRDMTLQVRTQWHSIAGRSVELVLPADPEQGLHDAVVAEAAGTSGCDPYWGLLWAAAPQTAEMSVNFALTRRGYKAQGA